MTLKPKSQNSQLADNHMVEPAPFDIYLCDNCEAELYSKEAYRVSESEIKRKCFIVNILILFQFTGT